MSARRGGPVLIAAALASVIVYDVAIRSASGAAGGWSPAIDLSARDGTHSHAPEVTIDATGNVIAMWKDGISGPLRVTRLDAATRAWSQSEVIATTAVVDFDVDTGDRDAVAVLANTDASVHWTRYDGDSGTWSAPGTLAAAEPASPFPQIGTPRPRVAVDADGDAVAVWISHSADVALRGLHAREYDAASGTWSSATRIGNGVGTSSADVAVDAAGNATAVWADRGSTETGVGFVHAARYDATTSTWSAAQTISGAAEKNPLGVEVAMAPSGEARAVWILTPQPPTSPPTRVIRSARFSTATDSWEAAQDASPPGFSDFPDVAYDAAGNATVVWSQHDATRTADIRSAHWPAGGAGWTPPVDLSASATDAVFPDVEAGPAGVATAVWLAEGRVQASARDTLTGAWSPPVDLSGPAVGPPRVALDPAGRATAVWTVADNGAVVQSSRRPDDGATPPPAPPASTSTTTTTTALATAPTTAPLPTPPPGFIPLAPMRVFDTRGDVDAERSVPVRKVGGGYALEVGFWGLAPAMVAGYTALSLNIAVTNAEGDGFVTAYPCGERPLVANVNYVRGQTVSNAAIVPSSPVGTVCFYSHAPVDLVVDLNGFWRAGSGLTAVKPSRVFDTRPGNSPGALRAVGTSKVHGEPLRVRMVDLGGVVPASGVAAVVLNVAVTNAERAGYVNVHPCGPRNAVANLNYVGGQTVSNMVIAPVSAAGDVCFFSLAPVDLVVDVTGFFASGSPRSFQPIEPVRLFDSRPGESPNELIDVELGRLGGEYYFELGVSDWAGITPPAGTLVAVSLNVAIVAPDGPGFLVVWPCGDYPPVANANYTAGQVVSNSVIAVVDPEGWICVDSYAVTDIVIDINGWFPV